jgi:hypothetical protein
LFLDLLARDLRAHESKAESAAGLTPESQRDSIKAESQRDSIHK